jgi:hypothetical protein
MGSVLAVSARSGHHFSKTPSLSIRLLKGLGVAGDAHMGETVKHRSRVRRDPTQPNLRQVHLIHADVRGAREGFVVQPADLGENVTTEGIDLLALPSGTRPIWGASGVVEITGLRNPPSDRRLPEGCSRPRWTGSDGNLVPGRRHGHRVSDGDAAGDAIRVKYRQGATALRQCNASSPPGSARVALVKPSRCPDYHFDHCDHRPIRAAISCFCA